MRRLSEPPPPGPSPDRRVLTVAELNAWVREILDEGMPLVWVEGEISNLRRYPSGHTYFTLKDETAQVSAVLFRGQAAWIRFRAEDGLKVIVRGRVGLYEARGAYQIVVEAMEPAGLGSLQLALEQLKARLRDEGLLDPARKRPLPALPRRIGVVTSPHGAALRDILRVLERRFATLEVVIAPARVQGEGAAAEIARGVRDLERLGVDVIIVTRGGGSVEDLWAFNEEVVARALAASGVPVLSAVGHEIDVTLSDLVADLRAPTPSAAAEMVVVSRTEIVDRLAALRSRLVSTARLAIATGRQRLLTRGVERASASVARGLRDALLRLDDLDGRLRVAGSGRVAAWRHRFDLLALGLTPARLRERLRGRRTRLEETRARLRATTQALLRREAGVVGAFSARLTALSPLQVLARGYAICYAETGEVILRDARVVRAGAGVRVRLHRGRLACVVKEVEDVPTDEAT